MTPGPPSSSLRIGPFSTPPPSPCVRRAELGAVPGGRGRRLGRAAPPPAAPAASAKRPHQARRLLPALPRGRRTPPPSPCRRLASSLPPLAAFSFLRLAPSLSLAASVPSCPAGRALVPGPGPAARCRRSEQLSSACSGFGTRCYESKASRAPRPAGGVGCAAGPETGISPQLASPSGDSLAPSLALLCLGGAGRVREEPSLSCACGISADMTAWGKFESLLLALLALCAGLLTAAQGKAGSPAARAMREPSEARLASPGSVRRRVACRGAGLRRWLSTADAQRSRCRQGACIALSHPHLPRPTPALLPPHSG